MLSVFLADSSLGFRKTVTLLDDSSIVLCSKKGECVCTSDVLVLPCQGMPVYSQRDTRGRLFVRIRVDIPRKLWCSVADAAKLERLLGRSGQGRSRRRRGRGRGGGGWSRCCFSQGELKQQGKQKGGHFLLP